MAFRVVCISRTMGAGGEEIGRLVAERLGFAYVDERIVARAAEKGGISPADVADTERRQSALRRLLDEIALGAAVDVAALGGMAGAAVPDEPPADARGLILDVIEETAGRGEVVIVAHAASFALSGRDDVLRVLVTASPETRAARYRGSIKESDAARADYLRRFHGVKAELPTHYDLVVNTDVLGVERAAELVALAAS